MNVILPIRDVALMNSDEPVSIWVKIPQSWISRSEVSAVLPKRVKGTPQNYSFLIKLSINEIWIKTTQKWIENEQASFQLSFARNNSQKKKE